YAASRRGRRGAQIELAGRRSVRIEGEDRPREELEAVVRAARDVASGAVRVVRLDLAGTRHRSRKDEIAKARREALDLRLDARGHVHRRAVRDVAVRPEGVLSRRGAGVVEKALLRDEHEGLLGMAAAVDLGFAGGDFLERAADVHRAGAPALRGSPGHGPPEGVVDLENSGSAPVPAERATVAGRQSILGDAIQGRGRSVEQ